MSLTAREESNIENAQADFDMFLAKQDWKNAQAVIDSLRDIGQGHLADILRKAYLKKQYEVSDVVENDFVYEPIEENIPVLENCYRTIKKAEFVSDGKMEDAENFYRFNKQQV